MTRDLIDPPPPPRSPFVGGFNPRATPGELKLDRVNAILEASLTPHEKVFLTETFQAFRLCPILSPSSVSSS